MRKLIAAEWMSLDGVVQAPGSATEDPSAGFLEDGALRPLRLVESHVTTTGAILARYARD
jgi:hypothetical protein